MLAFSAPVFAVDFTVNLTTDQHDASLADSVCDIDLATAGEQCSLRAAVEQANNLLTRDRILFNLPSNSVITLTELNGGQIQINGDALPNNELQIIGPGANNLTIDGGSGTNRIFSINNHDTNTTAISGVTLTGGNGNNSSGGAIDSEAGVIMLDRVYIYGNNAVIGGGVYTVGLLVIRNSTISENIATGNCGGICSFGTGTAIVNSTVSGNSSGNFGGGICVNGSSNSSLTNVTITNNSARYGGGTAYLAEGSLRLRNTIVASNTVTEGVGPEIYSGGLSSAGIISEGYNLIGDQSGDSDFTNNPVTYQSTDIVDKDPMLDAVLQNNGGPTPIRALLAGSPAIDKGNNSLAIDPLDNSLLITDQRGLSRIVDGNGDNLPVVDIGAYEVQLTPTAATVSVSGRVTTITGTSISSAQVSLMDSQGNTRTTVSNSLGYYLFDDVEAGSSYIITVTAKRFSFNQASQVLNVNEETAEVNFIASPVKRLGIE